MRRIRHLCLVLLVPSLLSCGSDSKPCDPSQPCGKETYSLQVTVRDEQGAPVEGLEVFGRTIPDTPFGPVPKQTAAAAAMQFTLPQTCVPQIDIFDVHGERVRRLVPADTQRPPGVHQVVWDGRDDGGLEVPGGVYRLVFTAFDTDETVLFSDEKEGFLNAFPVAMGKTDADGILTATDAKYFPNLILGDDHELPLVAGDGSSQGVFDLSGGTQILLRDSQGLLQWVNVQLSDGVNELDLQWCPTCPVPVTPVPISMAHGPLTRPSDGPDPIPPLQFGFTGVFPNPFN
jgi:hypothetical protein